MSLLRVKVFVVHLSLIFHTIPYVKNGNCDLNMLLNVLCFDVINLNKLMFVSKAFPVTIIFCVIYVSPILIADMSILSVSYLFCTS